MSTQHPLSSRIAHFTLATRDVRSSEEFFHRTLGWEPIRRPGNISSEAAWLRIAPGQELHLLYSEGFEVSPFEMEFGRHFAIDYPLEGFDALKARLVENGATLIDAIRETPFERFFFRDPNGYIFEIIEMDHVSET